jgi:excisionase family DNA binding protein
MGSLMTTPKRRKTDISRTNAPRSNEVGEGSTIVEQIRAKKSALSVMELATMMGTGKATVYRLIKSGRLPAYQFGDSVRLDPQITAAWLEERTLAA